MKKQLLYFAVAIILILLTVVIVKNKSYPIASVNGNFVPVEHFQTAVSSGRQYYTKEKEVAEKLASDPEFVKEFEVELKRATLDAIIRHEIIREELVKLIGQEEANKKVQEKVDIVESEKSETTQNAVAEIFGLDWPTYVEIVIRPEARLEILEEEVIGRSLDFEEWLDSKLQKAEVEILLTGFVWLGNSVELN